MRRSKIVSTGGYLPEKILTNAELEEKVETSAAWIEERVGIKQRHIAAEGEMASDMAVAAARMAISHAGLQATDIDLIVVATSTGDHVFPSTACEVQAKLAIGVCPAFDVSAACSGFVYALHMADLYIQSGQVQTALVIGSEVMSRVLDWRDRNTCVLFGDGAGAVVLTASEGEAGIISSHLHAEGRFGHLLTVPNLLPGQHSDKLHAHVHMAGKEVFKLAVNTLEKLVISTLADNHIEQRQISWLIPHQANRRIIEATAKKLNLPMEQVVLTLPLHGNTSCASIPLALHAAVSDGRVQTGDLLLLEAFGAGLTWGAALVRY